METMPRRRSRGRAAPVARKGEENENDDDDDNNNNDNNNNNNSSSSNNDDDDDNDDDAGLPDRSAPTAISYFINTTHATTTRHSRAAGYRFNFHTFTTKGCA